MKLANQILLTLVKILNYWIIFLHLYIGLNFPLLFLDHLLPNLIYIIFKHPIDWNFSYS